MSSPVLDSLINGKALEQVSIVDRGLLYGQSVFETIPIVGGAPALLGDHLERLKKGCEVLSISIDFNALSDEVNLISSSRQAKTDCILRITITQGSGGRGYQNPASPCALRILTLHDLPQTKQTKPFVVGLSSVQLAHQTRLAGIKHGNRLEQVIARSEWKSGWSEAILLDSEGYVVEGTQSNIILLKGNSACTPIIDRCGVNGVMKNWVIQSLKESGFQCAAGRITLDDIERADELIMTNSLMGARSVDHLELTHATIDFENGSMAQKLNSKLREHEIIPSY